MSHAIYRLIVVATLGFAFALRIIGIDFGQVPVSHNMSLAPRLPTQAYLHPDEYFYVAEPVNMLAQERLNPRFFENPSFLIYINALTFWITGEDLPTDEELASLSQRSYAPFHLYVIGRVYSVLGGLLAVAAAIGLAHNLGGRRVAIVAGLLTSLSFPLVQHSHYATTSSLAVGFGMISIWASMLALRHPRRLIFWVIAGTTAGLAMGNRYNAGALSIFLFVIGLVAMARKHDRSSVLRVLVGYFSFPLSFFATTPYAIIDFRAFWSQFSYITSRYATSPPTFDMALPSNVFMWQYIIILGLGGAGVVGILYLVPLTKRRMSDGDWQFGSAILAATAVVIPYSVIILDNNRIEVSDQLSVPILPILIVGVALGVAHLYQNRKGIALGILTISIGCLLIVNTQWLLLMSNPDTRLEAANWIYDNVPQGTSILVAGAYNVALDPADYDVTTIYHFGDFANQLGEDNTRFDLVVVSDAIVFLESRLTGHRLDTLLEEQIERLPSAAMILDIQRPMWWFADMPLNNASYWHHPSIRVYCLNESICERATDPTRS